MVQKPVFACLLVFTLLAPPLIAQQNDSPELTVKAAEAIDNGLKYLLANQREDGSWASSEKGDRAIAVTSLGLMAFMSRGEFPGSGPNGPALTRAKDWLLKQAQATPKGYMGSTMYEHGLATLALTEMWGMTGEREDQAPMQKAIEAAVDVIVRSQSPSGGWRYQPSPTSQDTSVTAMVFIGLASARQAGVPIPNETIKKALEYFDVANDEQSGGFVYTPSRLSSLGGVSVACTAGGAFAAQLAGLRETELVEGALRFLEERGPAIFKGTGHFYYCHYYALQAMVQSSDERYAKWYPQIRDALIARQDQGGDWTGKAQGTKTVGYETPMAIITLATPYRYIPIYQR